MRGKTIELVVRSAFVVTASVLVVVTGSGCVTGPPVTSLDPPVIKPSILGTAPVDPVCFAYCAETIGRLEAEAAALREQDTRQRHGGQASMPVAETSDDASVSRSTSSDDEAPAADPSEPDWVDVTCKHCGVVSPQFGIYRATCPNCGMFGWY